jgi:hypothetical protein
MLAVEIITHIKHLQQLREEWLGLLTRSATNEPPLSPDWLCCWWLVFGQVDQRSLRVLTVRDGVRLVGVVPLLMHAYRHRSGLRLNRLELLGSGEEEPGESTADYLGIIAEHGYEQRVVETFVELLEGDAFAPWDELLLRELDGQAPITALTIGSLRRIGMPAVAIRTAAPYLTLPKTWDAFVQNLPNRQSEAAIRQTLETFEAWAKDQWSITIARTHEALQQGQQILRQLEHAHRASTAPNGAAAGQPLDTFQARLMPALFDAGALELCWLSVRNEPVAILYNVVWDNKVHSYGGESARNLPNAMEPELVLHLYTIQRAIREGRREYDFHRGQARAKLRLTEGVRPLRQILLSRPTSRVKLRHILDQGLEFARASRHLLQGKKSFPH